MKVSGILAALVLGLLSRVFAEYALPNLGVHSSANIENLSAIIQYAVMFGLGALVARQADAPISVIFGVGIKTRYLGIGIWFAVLLLMLTFGVNALETWAVAQFRPKFAYRFWSFHAAHYYISMPLVSFVVLAASQFVCAPIVEEFIFRGLLFRAWLNHGCFTAITGVAVLFTLLHFEHHYWLTTFIFSIVLSVLYVKYGSLWVNISAHAANNIFAFLVQYYFDFHWTRPRSHLTRLEYWVPELVMLAFSIPLLLMFLVRSRPSALPDNSSQGLLMDTDSV